MNLKLLVGYSDEGDQGSLLKKTLALTFIIGAVTGSALTIYLNADSAIRLPGEVKVLTKTEYKNIPTDTINYNALDIPGESVERFDDSQDMETPESVGYEIPDEGAEAIPTQMDKFERSIASEAEPQTPTEELPTSVPEEAPAESPPEIPDDTNEDENK